MKSSFLKSTVALVTCGLLAFGAAHAYADQQKLPSGTSYDQIGQKIENYYQEHEKPAQDWQQRSLTKTAILSIKRTSAIRTRKRS